MPRVWGTRANGDLQWRLNDGIRNILSVGPFVESSNLERLVTVFAFYLSFGYDARLVLLGSITDKFSLADRFYAIVAQSGLSGRIVLLDPYRRAHASAAFAASNLYVSLDEGEASPEPFLDAMAFGVPILGVASPSSRSILGAAGILVSNSAEDIEIGTLAHFLSSDESLRKSVLLEQRRRLRTEQLAGR